MKKYYIYSQDIPNIIAIKTPTPSKYTIMSQNFSFNNIANFVKDFVLEK